MVVDNDATLSVKQVAVCDLKLGNNVRKDICDDVIAELAASLKEKQWQPILVMPDMTILDGFQRHAAAVLAQIKFLWAIITERVLTDQERIAAQLVMGLHRKDFSEQEKVLACEQWIAACPGIDQKQLAAKLNIDPATVCKWLSVSTDRVIPEVRQRFLDGSIKLMHTYALSQVPKGQQAELLAFALRGATRSQIETQVRRQKHEVPSVQVNKVRFLLPGGTAVTLTGEAMSVGTVIDHLTALLNEVKKAQKQKLDIKTMERVLSSQAKADQMDN